MKPAHVDQQRHVKAESVCTSSAISCLMLDGASPLKTQYPAMRRMQAKRIPHLLGSLELNAGRPRNLLQVGHDANGLARAVVVSRRIHLAVTEHLRWCCGLLALWFRESSLELAYLVVWGVVLAKKKLNSNSLHSGVQACEGATNSLHAHWAAEPAKLKFAKR